MQIIYSQFLNGFTLNNLENILGNIGILENYTFKESDNPKIVFFGPYGNPIFPKGNYIRVGLFPECIFPPLELCDYAFGAISPSIVNSDKYHKIGFWGIDPKILTNKVNNDPSEFCSFFYSHQIAYREQFFNQLSQYKKINAPGLSKNNHPSVDSPDVTRYQAKLNFLGKHKFDIAFENYVYPGYVTEKITESFLAGCVPIYMGDPLLIEESYFNPKAFIYGNDFFGTTNSFAKALEKISLEDFDDYRPAHQKSLKAKIKRKSKFILRNYRMKNLSNSYDFTPLIDHIKTVDQDADLFNKIKAESPICLEKAIKLHTSQKTLWETILSQAN